MAFVTVIVIARLQSKPNNLKEIDMEYFMMYLLTQLNSFKMTLLFFSIISAVVICGIIIMCSLVASDYCGYYKETFQEYAKMWRLKLFIVLFCVFCSAETLLPSTKQAAFIYIAPQIIANGDVKDSIKAIPELAKLGTDYLKTMLKDKIEESKN